MMEQKQQPKWEGKVSTKLKTTSADQIWPLYKDFFNLNKWFPDLPICYGIHGTNGEPGCVRYCVSSSIPSIDGDSITWAKERLVQINNVNRSLSYEIVSSNIGVKSYKAMIKIIPFYDYGQKGCVIEWLFTLDPIEGGRLEDLIKNYEVALQLTAKKMQDALDTK